MVVTIKMAHPSNNENQAINVKRVFYFKILRKRSFFDQVILLIRKPAYRWIILEETCGLNTCKIKRSGDQKNHFVIILKTKSS